MAHRVEGEGGGDHEGINDPGVKLMFFGNALTSCLMFRAGTLVRDRGNS